MPRISITVEWSDTDDAPREPSPDDATRWRAERASGVLNDPSDGSEQEFPRVLTSDEIKPDPGWPPSHPA